MPEPRLSPPTAPVSQAWKRSLLCLLFACLSYLPCSFGATEIKLTAQDLDFFEKKIRPIFVENCYKCHSHDSEKIKGGLLLDTRDGVLKGGETGPAVVPGNLEKSLLIEAVHYTNKDLQMPPNDRKLEPEQIQALEAWVKMGAPDPRTGDNDGAHKYVVDMDKARKHWSFQPIAHPAVPKPEDPQHWEQTPIDNFILATLLTKGLTPSAKADRVTLIRRATFDLIGLPPTPKEVDDFTCDTSPDAFAKVVDRLLASPHYGERWGRYWLDIAHFADTAGVTGNGRDERYAYSYTYRDYVIRAFNEDLPYDQFLMQQIAADQLPLGDDKHPLAAMGFLTLGNRFNGQINDIIDDRIDVLAKGTMAMTATCARCHDHKFDPIPTLDYYALHGVFNNSIEPKEEPLLEAPKNTPAYIAFKREYEVREAALKEYHDELMKHYKEEVLGKADVYLLALHDYESKTNEMTRFAFNEKRGLNPIIGNFWYGYLKYWENHHNPVMAPWFAFSKLDSNTFAEKAKEVSATIAANHEKGKPINPLIARMFAEPPASLNQVAARYAKVFANLDEKWQEVLKSRAANGEPPSTLPVRDQKGFTDKTEEQLRLFMYAPNSPMLLDDQRLNQLITRELKLRNKRLQLEKAVIDLVVTDPGSPARGSVLEDAEKAKDSNVFIKGNPGNRGPVAPRHFFSILSNGDPQRFTNGSGRLELAKDIASKDNPLTARVIVNRVWLHHFCEGLVRTPDDFGSRGDTPSHPELLDYLASRFIDQGWSIKKLHRLMMLSSVYQQTSDEDPHFEQIDPENRWLWRMNRRRLDFESLRDSILAIGGDLDMTMGGRPVKLDAEPYSLRRTIYGLVDRRGLPNMYAAFDFASPDLTTGRRESTVVPQQALFMMNNALVVQQARNVVRRADFKNQTGPEARVQMLYQLIYQRNPTELETRLALDYMRTDATTEWQTNAQAAWEYGYGTLDPATGRVRVFAPMANFANRAWMPAAKSLDARLKGLAVTPDGGIAGPIFGAIRRWTAPRDGFISVESALLHQGKDEPVTGTIVSSLAGQLGQWDSGGTQTQANLKHVSVKRGETIDFFACFHRAPKNGNFKWSPVIKMETPPGTVEERIVEWRANRDFSGQSQARGLTAWEKFAQVLLETNELTFIN